MKTFTITAIDNRTYAIDIQADSAEEAKNIFEENTVSDCLERFPYREVHSECGIEEITENKGENNE